MIRYIIEIGDPVTHRFSSAVRNPIEPTNATYPDSIGDPILYPVRLSIPKIKNKISDSISGTVKIPQYKFNIANDDGKFDDVETLGWFNIPVVLKRSDIDDPTLDDFNIIVSGTIDYSNVMEKSVQIITNNVYRSLTEEVTKTFNTTDYPNLPDNLLDKDVPISYGPDLMNVPLFQINSLDLTKYLAIDPDYLTGVTTVYDSDGNSISFTGPDVNGIITATDAATADISGVVGNTIGDIITSELALKSAILYTSDNWDITETNEYITNSAQLNFYFSGGTVRQLVDAALKSDNAFLFTKNNGLLTLRQWGRNYVIHTIQNWQIMPAFPKKDFKDALKYYNSLASILFEKNISTGIHAKQISSGTNPAFNKERKVSYPTDLYNTGEITDLGDRMIKRFGTLSEIIPISSGEPTTNINLLDEIQIDVTINDRQLSSKTKWIVREGDPGQDMLSLEAKSGFVVPTVIDGILSQPISRFSTVIDGILSQPFEHGFGNQVNSQPIIVTGEE